MNELKTYYTQQLQQLDRIINEAQRFLKNAPEGSLHVMRSHNSIQYAQRISSPHATQRYIKRSEEFIARQLAQKDYAIKILKLATKRKNQLLTYDTSYNWDELAKFHETFSLERQALITPFVTPNDVFTRNWLQGELNKKKKIFNKYPLDPDSGFETEQGELVRSKSEKILADKLYLMGIPYIYESPLHLPKGGTIYPDFTILNIRTRKQMYWEHFGMMDNSDYANSAIKKINNYQKNHIYSGKNLIATYETSTLSLNTKVLEELISEFLL